MSVLHTCIHTSTWVCVRACVCVSFACRYQRVREPVLLPAARDGAPVQPSPPAFAVAAVVAANAGPFQGTRSQAVVVPISGNIDM